MDIKITNSSLRKFLETPADVDTLAENISLCGPTFDRIHKTDDGDYIFEIEAITNRVDTASSQGVAREAATILTQFGIPAKMINDPYKDKLEFRKGLPKQFHFNIANNDLVVRHSAVSFTNVDIKDSPDDTKKLLTNCGERPINNAVDITNELTLLYGMPSHIFDLDKLAAQELIIRESNKGEEITTLDGINNKLRGGDIVIEDGNGRLVDLCGVMGGVIAEVDAHTKNILMIVPVYQPKKIRQTSLYLQKRTLASQIFEKQPDPELSLPVLNKAIQLFKERTGAEVSSDIFDYYPNPRTPKVVSLDLSWLDKFIGVAISKDQIISILSGLGFSGNPNSDGFIECVVPSFRYHDINIKEDLAEEIARIYGYFRLPSVLPTTPTTPEKGSILLESELKAKKYLANIGFHEIYNNSLISLDLINKSDLNPSSHLKLTNALSSDYEYLRITLIPSLLQNLRNNQGKTDEVVNLLEIANTYIKQEDTDLPQEVSILCFLTSNDYREAKGYLEALFNYLNYPPVHFDGGDNNSVIFNEKQNSNILTVNGPMLGKIGHIKPQILRNFGITSNPVLVEINFASLCDAVNPGYIYHPISEYPPMIEDITLQTDNLIGDTIEKIYQVDPLITSVKYLDSYNNKHTFKISFGSPERNLEQKEVNSIKEKIAEKF